MKRSFIILAALVMMSGAYAQSPEKISYQAIIRNSSNALVISAEVGMRISILRDSASGISVYSETQTPVTTADGVVTLEIGTGTSAGSLSDIDWTDGIYFIKTETDPAGGTNYSISSTCQLMSVPYAFYADITGDKFSGKYSDLTGTPDFTDWDRDSTDNVTLAGNQIIDGNKAFTGKTIVLSPVNAQDVASKAYVDSLQNQFTVMENELINRGIIVKDVDGNIYQTLRIGSQLWMAENLKTPRYNDGIPIPRVSQFGLTFPVSTGVRGYINNDSARFNNIYGALYNWFTVNSGKLCPTGWHVPSDDEWSDLIVFLGGTGVAGGKLKETGIVHWSDPNEGATNETGFTALPGGYSGNHGSYGWWWSSTDYPISGYPWLIRLNFLNGAADRMHILDKYDGVSVRCLKD
jgi:uncharacterized protein (TIGR02145 family)